MVFAEQGSSFVNLVAYPIKNKFYSFGCDKWLSFEISTFEELETALKKARAHPQGVYIEIITDMKDYGSPMGNF